MNISSVFIAGTMQGINQGTRLVDQNYRFKIKELLNLYYPIITVHCPLEIMYKKFGSTINELQTLISKLSKETLIFPKEIDNRLKETTETFHELLNLVSISDLLIAYLPNQEPSMGTAMEMLHANKNNKPIICITDMKENLAILATSTVIISSLVEFETLLRNKIIETLCQSNV